MPETQDVAELEASFVATLGPLQKAAGTDSVLQWDEAAKTFFVEGVATAGDVFDHQEIRLKDGRVAKGERWPWAAIRKAMFDFAPTGQGIVGHPASTSTPRVVGPAVSTTFDEGAKTIACRVNISASNPDLIEDLRKGRFTHYSIDGQRLEKSRIVPRADLGAGVIGIETPSVRVEYLSLVGPEHGGGALDSARLRRRIAKAGGIVAGIDVDLEHDQPEGKVTKADGMPEEASQGIADICTAANTASDLSWVITRLSWLISSEMMQAAMGAKQGEQIATLKGLIDNLKAGYQALVAFIGQEAAEVEALFAARTEAPDLGQVVAKALAPLTAEITDLKAARGTDRALAASGSRELLDAVTRAVDGRIAKSLEAQQQAFYTSLRAELAPLAESVKSLQGGQEANASTVAEIKDKIEKWAKRTPGALSPAAMPLENVVAHNRVALGHHPSSPPATSFASELLSMLQRAPGDKTARAWMMEETRGIRP